MVKEIDESGEWEVKKRSNCKVRVLTMPSQSFLNWQATNPPVEEELIRNLPFEIDELRARLDKLEVKA